MKSLIFTIVAIIFIGAMLGVSMSNPDKNYQNPKTLNTLLEINKEYNNYLFYSLFSIKELKTSSLNSIEKFANYNDDKWISPVSASEILDQNEKEQLLNSTARYIDNINDDATKFNFILKIKRWCLAESQMEFICRNFSFRKEFVVSSFDKIPEFDKVISEIKMYDSTGNKVLKTSDYDKAYFSTINYLSELPINKQMEIYSILYKELSDNPKN